MAGLASWLLDAGEGGCSGTILRAGLGPGADDVPERADDQPADGAHALRTSVQPNGRVADAEDHGVPLKTTP